MKENHKDASAIEAQTQECNIEQEVEFGVVYRWQHWIRALSIVV